MNVVVRGVLVLLSVVTVLAGCAMDPKSPPPDSLPVPKTTALRPVTIPYRDGLAYTYEETSAQALCHALSPREWHSLLGADVTRTIEIDHGFDCVVTGGSLTVRMSMVSTEPFPLGRDSEPERMGGYPAWAVPDEVVVDLADGRRTTWARPYLHIRVAGGDQRDLLRPLVTSLLARVAQAGPATPVENAGGVLAFTPTEPVPGVRLADLPMPVQALVLCTAMTRTGATAISNINMSGQCAADEHLASVSVEDDDGGPARFAVGGRPARFTRHGAIVITLAEVPWHDPAHLYFRLTLEWWSADRASTTAWADQFVAKIGEL